jgi:hypothetical protein
MGRKTIQCMAQRRRPASRIYTDEDRAERLGLSPKQYSELKESICGLADVRDMTIGFLHEAHIIVFMHRANHETEAAIGKILGDIPFTIDRFERRP